MYSLLNGIYEEFTYLPERRLLILGVENAGKTCILEQIKHHFGSTQYLSHDQVTPTVGLNVGRLRLEHERLLIWDLGGAKSLRPIWERYLDDAEALIWVYDATDRGKMCDARETLKGLLRRRNLINSPLLVFANKQDKGGSMSAMEVCDGLDLFEDAEIRPQCVQPASSKTGVGIKDGIQWILYRLRNPTMEYKTSVKEMP